MLNAFCTGAPTNKQRIHYFWWTFEQSKRGMCSEKEICYQTGTQEANAPLVPEFLLKEQCQSSGWQQHYEKLINSEQNQTKIKG